MIKIWIVEIEVFNTDYKYFKKEENARQYANTLIKKGYGVNFECVSVTPKEYCLICYEDEYEGDEYEI